MKPLNRQSPGTSAGVTDAMVAINEALILGSVRQHELTEAAETLNTRLQLEIAERKRAEDGVRISEVRYRHLFETASDGLLLVDPVSGRITVANLHMTQLSGYPQDQLVGKQLWEIGLFGNRTANRQMFGKLKKVPEVRYDQIPLKHRDGRRQVVEIVANLYRENGAAVVYCHVRDITARKNAEATQRRLDVLAASHAKMEREIVRRQAVEESLRKAQEEQISLLEQSRTQGELLRDLSRKILTSQEDERKRISRELHDVISQDLIAINVSIATLAKGDPATFPGTFKRKIANTLRIVESAVDQIHHFARELRSTVLDDFGLIPALHSYLERFMKETGIRATLSAFARIETADGTTLTALYRVAQEALANVARHAGASRVAVSITCFGDVVQMEIQDDGCGFDGAGQSRVDKASRLGLLGMEERIAMVGGSFHVESFPGQGTTVRATFSNLFP